MAQVYRCRHQVEAMRWIDTDENRMAFADWFAKHDAMFETMGPVVKLPGGSEVAEGQWIVCMSDDFVVFAHDVFVHEYEAVWISTR